MKNLNKRLSEAIDRGINIALDDYENDVNDIQLSTKSDIIKNHSSVTMRILIQNFLESKNYKLKCEKIYKDILEEMEKYQVITEEEEKVINEFDEIAKKMQSIQKKQEVLCSDSIEREEERNKLFNDFEQDPSLIEKKLLKIEKQLLKIK